MFRLTQHWNQRKPDPRAQGLAAAMGWTKYKAGDDALRYEVPAITLEALASQLKKSLGTRGGIRAIGDRTMTVRRIGLLPGYTMIQASIAMMPTVDVIVAGEVQEWESATYAQDVAFAGAQERLHLDRPRRQRSAGNAGLRRLAEDDRLRSAGPVHLGGRSLLEAAVMRAHRRRSRQPHQGRDGRPGRPVE